MGVIPDALYSALAKDVGQVTGLDLSSLKDMFLCPTLTHAEQACSSLLRALPKKMIPRDTTEQDEFALEKFHSFNSKCESWVACLNTSGDEELWGTFKNVLYQFFNPHGMPLVDSLDSIVHYGRCGPGSSIEGVSGDFYSKMFSSTLTSTSRALGIHYRGYVWNYPEWSNAETIRQANYGESKIVEGSKIVFVPKNDKISRMICSEPTLNMFYQLGLGTILERRLRSFFGIDLSLQPDINRALAASSSVDQQWATIDLESASDSLAVGLAKEVLPSEVWSLVKLLRSPLSSYKGRAIPLHMISTMGNGFTFPLQTVLFASMVKAVYLTLGLKDSVHVFGDDIVVRKDAVHRLMRGLSLMGCVVNPLKSFSEGPFRESCGCDYFNGINIRGVFPSSLQCDQDWYTFANGLNEFSARTGVILQSLMNFVVSQIKGRILRVPPTADAASGLRVPLFLAEGTVYSNRYYARSYELLEFVPRKIRIGDGFIRTPTGMRKIIYNPSGLLIAMLSGIPLSSGLPLRKSGRWKAKRRVCSWWDELAPESLKRFSWQQWNTAVELNMSS